MYSRAWNIQTSFIGFPQKAAKYGDDNNTHQCADGAHKTTKNLTLDILNLF